MNAEDLKKLGLTDEEVIQKIIVLHGKDIEKNKTSLSTAQAELDGLKKQLGDANSTIEGFKKLDPEALQKAVDDWKSKAESAKAEAAKQIAALKFEHALDGALTGAKAKNAKAVKALLDLNNLKHSESVWFIRQHLCHTHRVFLLPIAASLRAAASQAFRMEMGYTFILHPQRVISRSRRRPAPEKDPLMKITILNGNPQPSPFDAYLAELAALLEGGAHSVTRIDLRSIPLRHCIGCWGCWVKTPGLCTCQDASLAMDQAVIESDFTLWASPLKMGFPSELLKMALDKHLPLVHPYLIIDQGEVHHLPRYLRSPRLGLLLEKGAGASAAADAAAIAGTDADDLQIVSDIHCRTALNFKSRLEFSLTSETPPADLAARITARHPAALPLPARPRPIPGVTVAPPGAPGALQRLAARAQGQHAADAGAVGPGLWRPGGNVSSGADETNG